jgi:hydroxypyruvate isomerase
MHRRDFLMTTLATGAAAAAATAPRLAAAQPTPRFKLKYAPHFGMFSASAGDDPLDQLRFMADQGFEALEDNGMRSRPVELQDRIAAEMQRLKMTMGVFVATADFREATFVRSDPAVRDRLLADMRASIETAKRVNARWCTVVPGCSDRGLHPDFQTANAIDNLKRCAELCEPAGLVMVLEPLNHRDHPGLFLTRIPQAFLICQAVNSPSCMILDDLYHQQVTEGNLIPNLDAAWSRIPYFQVGDNPGRNEPGTGEINYRNIFAHLYKKGYTGVVGMEHGNSQPGAAGERAVIDAYRRCDSF